MKRCLNVYQMVGHVCSTILLCIDTYTRAQTVLYRAANHSMICDLCDGAKRR